MVISDSSLIDSLRVVCILIQSKPQLALERAPFPCQTETQLNTPRWWEKGTNPTISPQAEVIEIAFPRGSDNLPVSLLKHVLVCSCRCCWCVGICAHLSWCESMEAVLCWAEPWLEVGGEVALPAVCEVLHSTPVFAQPQIQGGKQATVLTPCVSGDQGQMLSRQKDLTCSPSPEHQDLCTSWVYFSLGDVYCHYFIPFTFHWTLRMWALLFSCAACCLWLIRGIFKAWWLVYHIILDLSQNTERKLRLWS